jgi:hypothetical protein
MCVQSLLLPVFPTSSPYFSNGPFLSLSQDMRSVLILSFLSFASLEPAGRGSLEDSLDYFSEIQGADRFAIPIEFSFLKWGYGGGVANLASQLAKILLTFEDVAARLATSAGRGEGGGARGGKE